MFLFLALMLVLTSCWTQFAANCVQQHNKYWIVPGASSDCNLKLMENRQFYIPCFPFLLYSILTKCKANYPKYPKKKKRMFLQGITSKKFIVFSIQDLAHCSPWLKKWENNTHSFVAIATLLALVPFCKKTKYSHLQHFKSKTQDPAWNRHGSHIVKNLLSRLLGVEFIAELW